MGRLDGKVCVITGAGGGMGREAALLFSEEGAHVCAADVDGTLAETAAADCAGDALGLRCDVAVEDEVAAMYRANREALRRDRRALQQRRHLTRGRRVGARHDRRRLAAGAEREHAGRLPLLQARHSLPVSSEAAAR